MFRKYGTNLMFKLCTEGTDVHLGISQDPMAVEAILMAPWTQFDAQYACYLNAKYLLPGNRIFVRPYGDNGLEIVIFSAMLNFKIKATYALEPVTFV